MGKPSTPLVLRKEYPVNLDALDVRPLTFHEVVNVALPSPHRVAHVPIPTVASDKPLQIADSLLLRPEVVDDDEIQYRPALAWRQVVLLVDVVAHRVVKRLVAQVVGWLWGKFRDRSLARYGPAAEPALPLQAIEVLLKNVVR